MQRQILSSRIDRKSDQFRRNRDSVLEQLAALDKLLAAARAGGGEKHVARHQQRGKLLVRERIELLLDRDSPFLELSPVAAAGTEYRSGRVGRRRHRRRVGRGVLHQRQRSHGPRRRGQSLYVAPSRCAAFEISQAKSSCRMIMLTESGGADLPRQAEIFVPGGASFRDLTQLSALGIPTISLVFGNSTAGGAVQRRRCAITRCSCAAGPRCFSAARRW